jgi:hypothetical protein
MQYALLEEVRRLLDETGERSREILDAIFDPGALRSSEAELVRMVGTLAEDEAAPPVEQAPAPPAEGQSHETALCSFEELEAALLADQRRSVEEPATGDIEPTPTETPADAAPESVPIASLPMRVLDRAAAPLRALAAPLRALPPSYRPFVGVFALTLLLWYPAVRWIAGEAATASRVRPLSAVELNELSSALRAKASGESSKEKGQEKGEAAKK